MPVTADQYLRGILAREAVDVGLHSPVYQVQNALLPALNAWAGQWLMGVSPSGSFSKGTANKSGTDIDLFVSLRDDTPETLAEIYNKLDLRMKELGYVTRLQNVSIGITVAGQKVDLVPAKRQNLLTLDHSLYLRKAGTWRKTNVNTHAHLVQGCGRLEEIKILKLWRDQKGLEFPSFYIELTVINALGTGVFASPYGAVADNVLTVMRYLRDSFSTARVLDPANGNNVISDDLSAAEKYSIRAAAVAALAATRWDGIVV
ncbi:MAG: nucleotidyltransferase domain-containing protein [Proteobacteria bacterium]|nr:nucleotidyltransferase domain-containing protein [Pseudomonadota bacterium]